MNNFCHICSLWEDGRDGESYLKTVKNQFNAGLINGWQTWVLTNLLKEEVYEDWNPAKNIEQNIRNEVRIYGKYELAKDAFHSGYPFSAIMVKQRIYICYRNKGKVKASRIVLSNKKESTYDHLYYSIYMLVLFSYQN